MDQIKNIPEIHSKLIEKSNEIGFTMPSDLHVGALLKTLVSSKPNSNFLELGTGIGLSLSWMIDGMDAESRLTTIDNDQQLIAIANDFFGSAKNVEIICEDGEKWLGNYKGELFDLIFADAWPGKYSYLEETLALLKIGGIYVIDDMLEQPNWPKGHAEKATQLISTLEKRKDLNLTKISWSTGILIATKIA